MPTFDQTTISSGAPEEVWTLLYDPARFPEWWAGIGSVTPGGDTGDYTMFPDGIRLADLAAATASAELARSAPPSREPLDLPPQGPSRTTARCTLGERTARVGQELGHQVGVVHAAGRLDAGGQLVQALQRVGHLVGQADRLGQLVPKAADDDLCHGHAS